jgi:hypothetical protein
MPRRRALPVVVSFLLLSVAAAAAMSEEKQEALPMELYFSATELSRIAGYGEEPVSSVSVFGQVTCELCARPGADLLAFELPGNFTSTDHRRAHATVFFRSSLSKPSFFIFYFCLGINTLRDWIYRDQ